MLKQKLITCNRITSVNYVKTEMVNYSCTSFFAVQKRTIHHSKLTVHTLLLNSVLCQTGSMPQMWYLPLYIKGRCVQLNISPCISNSHFNDSLESYLVYLIWLICFLGRLFFHQITYTTLPVCLIIFPFLFPSLINPK